MRAALLLLAFALPGFAFQSADQQPTQSTPISPRPLPAFISNGIPLHDAQDHTVKLPISALSRQPNN